MKVWRPKIACYNRCVDKASFLYRIEQFPLGKLWVFAIRQGWAALFGGLLLCAILLTSLVQLPWLHQYDWLFLFAVLIQVFMVIAKLEEPKEVIVIVLFHLVGLAMELFKTSGGIGSWTYPGEAVMRLGNVPLFSGFMYAAVGSYLARSWRVLHLSFTHFPHRRFTMLLAALIYINFFTHHYLPDMRILLFVGLTVLFWRTTVHYVLASSRHRMPLLLGFGLIALFIWFAENIGTLTKTWLYPAQLVHWHPIGLQKLGSWYLLMFISFAMVDALHALSNKRMGRISPS